MRVTSESKLKFPLEIVPELPKLTDEEIGQFAVEIGHMENLGDVGVVVGIGKRILDRMYCGNWGTFQKYSRDDLSVVKFVQTLREGGFKKWSPTRVYRSVKLNQQSVQFGPLDRFSNLSVSHYFAVQGLTFDRQEQVLSDCDRKALTVEQLVALMRAERTAKKDRVQNSHADVRRGIERLIRDLSVHDKWVADLKEAALDADLVKRFDEIADGFAKLSTLVVDALAARATPSARAKAASKSKTK